VQNSFLDRSHHFFISMGVCGSFRVKRSRENGLPQQFSKIGGSMNRNVNYLALVLLLIITAPGMALAKSGYLTSFKSTYPAAAASRIDNCQLCHTTNSGGSRNGYGTAYAGANHQFAPIESSDSDSDGYSNIEEINALSYPGNATDHPSASGSAALSGIAVQGPASLAGGATATYTAVASYGDGSSRNVAGTWSVSPTPYATMSSSGVLTANQVSSDQTVTVNVSYTEGGATKSAYSSVTITAGTNQPTTTNPPGANALLTGLAILGPSSVNGGTSATYSAQASYNDGGSQVVSANWSENSSYGTISGDGVLTTSSVNTNHAVTITASYTQRVSTSSSRDSEESDNHHRSYRDVSSHEGSYSGGSSSSIITKTATLEVAIINGPPPEPTPTPNPEIGSLNNSNVIVLASNDLGMHCACPGFSTFMLLPPYNTIRAQVIRKGGEDPQVLGASSGIKVQYSIAENTDETLSADPNYQDWMKNAPKLGFNKFPVKDANGHIQSPITGAKLSGNMTARSRGWWEAVGIPAYPDASSLSSSKPLLDPLNGPNRNPYLTGNIKVLDSNNTVLAQTSITVPVAFGGCCSCHISVAENLGYPQTAQGSFEAMGLLHSQNSSGIDIARIDPDGDGTAGPIRCSQCHLDPAMGETTPPGGYTLNGRALPVSSRTFSDVLHRFHAQDGMVLGQYDSNIATNCYQCHPGNGINCYRGHHTNKSMDGANKLWCTDCHGDLNQRIAQNQMAQPWSAATLPKCATCHTGTIGENPTLDVFGGSFLNSMTHGGPLLCSTCHGSPHALNPSTLAHDNMQNAALQGGNAGPIGECSVCHTGRSGYSKPFHSRDD